MEELSFALPDNGRVTEGRVEIEGQETLSLPESAMSMRTQPGSGLGLSIVKSIIELHGGQVGCESELGFGSRFWFTVPLPPAARDLTVGAAPAREVGYDVRIQPTGATALALPAEDLRLRDHHEAGGERLRWRRGDPTPPEGGAIRWRRDLWARLPDKNIPSLSRPEVTTPPEQVQIIPAAGESG